MKPSVSFSGGSGLLATNWSRLLRRDFDVTLLLHQKNICFEGVKVDRIDLFDVNELIRHFEKNNTSYMIHAACNTNVDMCERYPKDAKRTNVDLSEVIAKACSIVGVKMIHISTDHLFSGCIPMLDETALVCPCNEYGRTKALAEHVVVNNSPDALILRTNFFGWGTSYRTSFSDFVLNSLRKNKELVLFTDVYFTPILVDYLVEAAHALLRLNEHGVYNLTGNKRVSKYEFGMLLAERFGLNAELIVPGSILSMQALVPRPLDMSMSNKKACLRLGYEFGALEGSVNRLWELEKTGVAAEMKSIQVL